MKVNIRHFDTCLSDYVTDWSGIVVGVYVDGTTTYADIREGLESELRNHDSDELESVTDDEIATGIADLFEGVADESAIFDSSLESSDDDDMGESPQAWFRVEVETESPEEEAREAERAERRETEYARLQRAYAAEREAIAEYRALWIAAGADVIPWQLEAEHGLRARRRALGMAEV